nr:hypothetical protein [Actinoplanes lichenis]
MAWIAGGTRAGFSVTSAIPPVFPAYATLHWDESVPIDTHERAVIDTLTRHPQAQPWWLGYLETGAHDVVFSQAPRVPLYAGWPYVLVEAGPAQALTWRRGHMRGDGALPDLFFPQDRSWLASALWDDTWTCVGGPENLIDALRREPLLNARRVTPDEDALPPGLTRE